MSLDKAVQHRKEKRRAYRKSKAFDRSCRPGGSCKWCADDRSYHDRKEKARAVVEMYCPNPECNQRIHPDDRSECLFCNAEVCVDCHEIERHECSVVEQMGMDADVLARSGGEED